jgi:decaprenylphospho-beta-D-ribofuranose 2-oxidase
VPDLDAFLDALKHAAAEWPMSMGWIDCLNCAASSMGRGILMAGRWAEARRVPRDAAAEAAAGGDLPVELPDWALNPVTGGLFNRVYYWSHWQKMRRGVVSPEPFFYPLDAILHWNRAYGPRGFTQYQCVVPARGGRRGVREFMKLLTKPRRARRPCASSRTAAPKAAGCSRSRWRA